jgi:hypothetical protein
MAINEQNIVIQPNVGVVNTTPKITFSGADASTNAKNIVLNVYPTSNGTLSFEGNTGQLFSITDSMSGTIFSVNDISGIPSIEVLDTGLVKLAQYSGNVSIGQATANDKLDIFGNLRLTSANNFSVFKPNMIYTTNIGNGSLTSITVNHMLNSNNIITAVKENSSGNVVYPDIRHTNTNFTIFSFVSAPTANQYSISMFGL